MPTTIALAGGSFIFLAFLLAFLAAIVFAYYSRTGSDITSRPFHDRGDAEPNAFGDRSQHVRAWTHGTGGPNRRNLPDPRPVERLEVELDMATRERLRLWRERSGSAMASGLVVPVDAARDHIRGPDEAPVTIVSYADFECPSCQGAALAVWRVQEERPGQVRFVFRHFPLADSHPSAVAASQAAEWAAARGRFWDMHDRIYAAGSPPTRRTLVDVAKRLGLDAPDLEQAIETGDHAARIAEDFDGGSRSGVNGTPTLFVNGIRHDDDFDVEALRKAVTAAARTPTPQEERA